MTWEYGTKFNEWVLHEASFKSSDSNIWKVWKLEIEWTSPLSAAKVQYQYEVPWGRFNGFQRVGVINHPLSKLLEVR